MKQYLRYALIACLMSGGVASAASVLDTQVETIDGKETTLAAYKPKATLVVNTASKCGFTKQYAGLEELYQKFKDQGLVVAGFPCNQFGGQEPGSNEEIATFCEQKFNVTFPMFSKVDVNGPERCELYTQLAGETSPFPGDIKWNFNKFLVDENGKIIARFDSKDAPMSDKVVKAVQQALEGK